MLRAGIKLRPAIGRSAASAKFLREPKAPVALGSDLPEGRDWETSRYTDALSLPKEELAGLKHRASKPKSSIKRMFHHLTGSLKRLKNRVSMLSFRSKDKKASIKLNHKIDDAIKAANFAEDTAEETVDRLIKDQYRARLGAVSTKDTKYSLARKLSDKKYIGPQGEENRGRFTTPYNTRFT